MLMDWLPAAVRRPYPVSALSFTERSDPKGCLHTTETSGWPGYSGGASAPHATVMPFPGKGVEVHQHTPFSVAARALRHPTGTAETNRDCVFQFELIGTCAKNGPGYYWPAADDAVLADLYRKVIAPLSDAFGIPLRAPTFMAYPASYGESNPNRMSGSRFDTYSGWLGHQHVPGNTHGDPGAFPWARMLALAGGDDDMPLSDDDVNKVADAVVDKILIHTATSAFKPPVDPGAKGEGLLTGLGRLYDTVVDTEGQVAALKSGLPAMVKAAVADAVVDVTVNVNGTPR